MMSSGRTLLTFSISSYVTLSALEVELACHREVSVGTDFDGERFILAVECPDAEMSVWEIRGTVQTFDPDSELCRQAPSGLIGAELV